MRGTEDLPSVTEGHIGYAVVPWNRSRGYAKQALARVLMVAHEEGFSRVIVSCERDNGFARELFPVCRDLNQGGLHFAFILRLKTRKGGQCIIALMLKSGTHSRQKIARTVVD